jgi:hypothetical protein
MRAFLVTSACCLCASIFIAPPALAQAESAAAQSQSLSQSATDKELREIAGELRLLRTEMRRISVNAQRAQVLIDRIRLQQEQVARVRHDISDVQEKLEQVRSDQARAKAMIKAAKKQQEAGLRDDEDVKAFTLATEELDNREQVLLRREAALATELELAQGTLAELDSRLEDIQREMAQPALDEAGKPAKRQD